MSEKECDNQAGESPGAAIQKKASPRLCCSFCGKTQDEVAKVVAGPGTYICNNCVDVCNIVFRKENVLVEPKRWQVEGKAIGVDVNPRLRRFFLETSCGFCAKPTKQVDGLIGDDQVRICNECVGLCNEILDDELFEGQPVQLKTANTRRDTLNTVVRQAMFGTRWYTICNHLMKQNDITVEDVKQEVARQLHSSSSSMGFLDVMVDGNMRPDQKSLIVLAKIYSQLEELSERITRLENRE